MNRTNVQALAARPGVRTPIIGLLTLVFAVLFGVALYHGHGLLFLGALFGVVTLLAVAGAPEKGLLLAVALVPLETLGQVVPGSSAVTWAKVALVAAGLAFLGRVLVLRERATAPRGAPALLVTLVSMLLGSTFWPDSRDSVLAIVAFVGQVGLLVLVANLVTDRTRMDALIAALVIASVPVAAASCAEVFLDRSVFGVATPQLYASSTANVFRVSGPFTDPNALGRYLVFAVAATLGAMRLPRFVRYHALLIAAVALQLFALVNTYSRGAVLAAMGVGVAFVVWQRGLRSRVAWIAFGGGLVAAWVLLSEFAYVALLERVGQISAVGDISRVRIFAMAIEAAWRRPLFGYGPDSVSQAIGAIAGFPVSPHNLYLEVLLASGVVGFAALATFVGGRLWAGLTCRQDGLRNYARIGVLCMVGVLVSGLTLHGLQENELWLSLALLVAAESLARRESAEAGWTAPPALEH